MREFDKNRDALAVVFKPDEMSALNQAKALREPLSKLPGPSTNGVFEQSSDKNLARAREAAFKLNSGCCAGAASIEP